MALNQIVVGPQQNSDSSAPVGARGGKQGDAILSQLHGRWYETNYRGNIFSGGMGLTSISNATFTTGTLGATQTPIAGIWNPPNSGVNAVIIKVKLGITTTNATTTGGGPFVWVSSMGNTAISTGNAPLNRLTGFARGSKCLDMSGVALTGLTTTTVVRNASSLNGGSAANFSFVGTAVGQFTPAGGINEEQFDGEWIVAPGGVLSLLGTTTPVAQSAVSAIVWEEVPV